jgi:hypothetical protein
MNNTKTIERTNGQMLGSLPQQSSPLIVQNQPGMMMPQMPAMPDIAFLTSMCQQIMSPTAQVAQQTIQFAQQEGQYFRDKIKIECDF